MARAVHRSGLVALGIATALMASCAFAAKEVVVAVGSNFTTLDLYDASELLLSCLVGFCFTMAVLQMPENKL